MFDKYEEQGVKFYTSDSGYVYVQNVEGLDKQGKREVLNKAIEVCNWHNSLIDETQK